VVALLGAELRVLGFVLRGCQWLRVLEVMVIPGWRIGGEGGIGLFWVCRLLYLVRYGIC
jgi:hypothetical protein